jgi:hypothetical protein
MSRNYNNKWGDIPNTYRGGVPIEYDHVKNVSAVWIERGSLRGSEILDQYLELSEPEPVFSTYLEKQRIEVKLLWFGRKPKVTWANVTILGEYRIIRNFSGRVLRDIGKKSNDQGSIVEV